MEEGSFRCDANISLRPKGRKPLGVKTELKNMNSFRNVQRALDFEIKRQTALLDHGTGLSRRPACGMPPRGYFLHAGKGRGPRLSLFPRPGPGPHGSTAEWVESVRSSLPELPKAQIERFLRDYGLPEYDAEVLTTYKPLANYFEAAVQIFLNRRRSATGSWANSCGN